MASFKHIRWCASLRVLNGARGRGFSTESLEETATGEVIAALGSHVKDGGKFLLSMLTKLWREEKIRNQRERDHLCQRLEDNQRERDHLCQRLEDKTQLLNNEKELKSLMRVELLKARGLNDTRGLFECLQENLADKANIASRLKGAVLWEAILQANPGLAACIQKCTNVPTTHVQKQALNCYNVLSQHIHAGKSLADLQVAAGGTIMFERGPLSPEQVQVLLCIGAAANVALDEIKK